MQEEMRKTSRVKPESNTVPKSHLVPQTSPQVISPLFLGQDRAPLMKPFMNSHTSQWLAIDCGSFISTTENDIDWQTDDRFINTGSNQQLRVFSFEILDSFRLFTEQNKNCYTLPMSQPSRYFIRAAFNYGNYDKLSKPPPFDLEIDGNKWTTVVTSLTKIEFYEVIYTSRGDNVSVCFARTKANQFPFISSLEAWPIPDKMYTQMGRNLAWLNSYRYNYGTNDPNDVILGVQNCTGAWAIINEAGTIITAELRPTSESTLPPIISAIELYTASDALITTGTSQDDCKRHLPPSFCFSIIHTFWGFGDSSQAPLSNWTDEVENHAFRVTLYGNGWVALPMIRFKDLSNNSLSGHIPEFLGNLLNLKLLNLDYNKFSGHIPHNILKKKIRFSVKGNPNVDDPRGSKAATIVGLAVGIPLALILVLFLGIACFLTRKRRVAGQAQVTAPQLGGPQVQNSSAHEMPVQENASTSMSMVPLIMLPQPGNVDNMSNHHIPVTNHVEPNILATENGEGTSFHTSMVPDMDMEELDELLEQHERARG
ncbi:hypothetical protein RJ639_012606 [Escallonia herrerae]|uniref:Malectin-like domain-containing protein n=1 Tax=Escallonia herrerae TaxID=1293975 RepID=A0AA88VM52_9ASTE|nr:hypothetical protein RJ639_012606 [Escallonia herrerae]